MSPSVKTKPCASNAAARATLEAAEAVKFGGQGRERELHAFQPDTERVALCSIVKGSFTKR